MPSVPGTAGFTVSTVVLRPFLPEKHSRCRIASKKKHDDDDHAGEELFGTYTSLLVAATYELLPLACLLLARRIAPKETRETATSLVFSHQGNKLNGTIFDGAILVARWSLRLRARIQRRLPIIVCSTLTSVPSLF
jgi:hypothetical protein